MRRIFILSLAVMLLVLFTSPLSSANLNQLSGRWVNTDSNTSGVTALDIQVSGTTATVQAWGKCHPADCDWGRVNAFVYGPNVQSNPMMNAQALTAVFEADFKQTVMIIKPLGGPNLQAEIFTRFTDGSGRSNYRELYTFNRSGSAVSAQLPVPRQLYPLPGSKSDKYPRRLMLRWNPVPGAVSYTVEIDCYGYYQVNTWCADIGQVYKIVPNLPNPSYSFEFVGAQPGRWRVWAVDSNGQESLKSGWWEFQFTR